MATKSTHHATTTSYSERADTSPHPLTAYLLRLMTLKKSNLCLSADVATTNALFSLAETCGPSIVILKTHYDLISNWDYHPLTGTGAKLAVLARKHGFLIFEDRKFGDIGHTVQLQYCEGTAKIIEWSHITNVNMVPGKLVIGGMAEAAARWRERRRFRVRTAISVGTPRAESEDGDLEEEGDRMEGLMQPPRSAPSSQLQSGSGSGGGNGIWDADYNLQNYRAANAGRKSSIVSITTVSQHYEPFDTKEERDASPFGDGWASIEEGPPFPGIEEAPLERGLLILAQMSSVGNFMTGAYTAACVEAAREHKDYVMGFISQESLNEQPDDQFVSMTPGCQLPPEGDKEGEASGEVKGDGLGQQYNTPEKIVGIAGNDVVIVGRGIIKAIEPRAEAERYRRQAWEAYEARIDGRS